MNLKTLSLALCLVLTGCGGGGGVHDHDHDESHDYSSAAKATYSYTAHQTPSNVYFYDNTIYIGSDLEPRENLRKIATVDDVDYFLGASRDGVGVDRILNYVVDLVLSDGSLRPFTKPPKLWLDESILENEALFAAFWGTVTLLNDALPPEFQIEIAGYLSQRRYAYEGDILVDMVSPSVMTFRCGEGAVACANSRISYYPVERTRYATIYLPDDFDAGQYSYNTKVVTHEFLHALGIKGHVDSIEFPDSIMGGYGDYFPNPGFTIHRIDREVLQIMYMEQRTDLYNDYGEWTDTTLHVTGRAHDDSFHFGTALFNGLPQPWARGENPATILAENRVLTGTATWDGHFLGFSGPSPLAGDVSLTVDMAELMDPLETHDLAFRDIYYLHRLSDGTGENLGEDLWFPTRSLDYEVRIIGNVFYNDDIFHLFPETEDKVTGAFFGENHEGMGGTLKRTDMVGAFGGGLVVEDDLAGDE